MEGCNISGICLNHSSAQQSSAANLIQGTATSQSLSQILDRLLQAASMTDGLNKFLQDATVIPQDLARFNMWAKLNLLPPFTGREAQWVRDELKYTYGQHKHFTVADAIRELNETNWRNAQSETGTNLDILVIDARGQRHIIHLDSKCLNECQILKTRAASRPVELSMKTEDPVVIEQFFKSFYTKNIDEDVSLQAVKELFKLSCTYEVAHLKVACGSRLGELIEDNTISEIEQFARDNQLLGLVAECRVWREIEVLDLGASPFV